MVDVPSAADLAFLDPDGSFSVRLVEDRAALRGLAGALDAMPPHHDDRGLARIELIAHRLAGAAGTFGRAAVGSAALHLEDHAIALRKGLGDRQAAALSLAGLLEALDRAIGDG